MIARGQVGDQMEEEIRLLSVRYGIPPRILEHEFLDFLNEEPGLVEGSTVSLKAIKTARDEIQSALGVQILYLPTYRRI
jgi:hypothetical protein